jgi:hypothetical protein
VDNTRQLFTGANIINLLRLIHPRITDIASPSFYRLSMLTNYQYILELGFMSFDEIFMLAKDQLSLINHLQVEGVLHDKVVCLQPHGKGMHMETFGRSSDGYCWRCADSTCRK